MPRNNNLRTSQPETPPPQSPSTQSPQSILDFVIPTNHVELPSNGKFYSEEHSLHNCETVEIKYISTKELDILTSENLLKQGVAVDRMIQGLLVDKTIKGEDLCIGDKNAIIVAARIGAFGSQYPVEFKCKECGLKNEHAFDLSKLDHKNLYLDEIKVTKNGTFFITLPQTKVDVECRLLTSKDEKYLEDLNTRNQKLGIPGRMLSDNYKLFIVSLNDDTDRGLVDEFVNKMPIQDLHHLAKIYEKTRPDIDLRGNIACNDCGTENGVTVLFTANFFWPE